MLSNGPSLNLHKARFSGSILLSQPTLQIKQAHSLATAKLHSRQSALPVQSDNSCFLLRAEAPTRPPGLFILDFHLRNYPNPAAPRIVGFAYTDTINQLFLGSSSTPMDRIAMPWPPSSSSTTPILILTQEDSVRLFRSQFPIFLPPITWADKEYKKGLGQEKGKHWTHTQWIVQSAGVLREVSPLSAIQRIRDGNSVLLSSLRRSKRLSKR
jgi:hypothetical protein